MTGDEKPTEDPSVEFPESHPVKDSSDVERRDGERGGKEPELKAKLAAPFVRALVEASIDPFFVVDPDWRIRLANAAASKLTGRSPEELVGMDFCRCFTEPVKAGEALTEVMKAGSVDEWPLQVPRSNGRVSFVLLHASVCRDDRGGTVGVLAVARDVTQRVRRKNELRKYREQLEELVDERTLALANANELLQQQIVERKNIEVALRKSEERFRRLAENAPDIIYRFELVPRRRFSYVSPGVERITGHVPDEYYADPDLCFRLVHPEDLPLLEGVLLRGDAPESLFASSFPAIRWVHKDGSIIWTEEHTVPIWDESGHLIAVEGIARNISQRKEAESALQTALQQLEGIIEFLPDATFVIDRERKVIAWNLAIQEMTGVSKEAILGKGDFAHALPFYGEAKPILIDQIFSWDADFENKCDYIRRKGQTLYAETSVPNVYGGKGAYLWLTASPLYDGGGNLIGAIESIRDITESKKAQEALKTTSKQLQGIIEFLPDATLVIDKERRVIAWNRAIEEMTGVGKGEILGRSDHAYAIPFYGEARPLLIDLVLLRDEEFEKKYEYVRTKGETLYAEAFVPMLNGGKGAFLWITASPLYGGGGNLIGAIESIRDVTDYRKLEDALRTNADKIKRFAYSVSHDLKSPIIGINGITRLLHKQYRDFLDERGKGFCDQILKASEQALALIEEINVFIKTKEIPLDFEAIQPKEVIAIVRDEFEALLSIRQIKWVEPETIPTIRADRVSILRVLRNLVDNALKYGGENLSWIEIGYGSSNEHHILSVSDDGVGIKTEDTERIFGVFQRNATSRGVEGTGLGLAIVKEIAEKHKGQVLVEPGVKKGTTFYLYVSKDL